MNITHKVYEPILAAMVRTVVKNRAEINDRLMDLYQRIPKEKIAGDPFCIFNFITSVKDGSDVTVGFPLKDRIESNEIAVETLPGMETLSAVHSGALEKLGETTGSLFAHTRQFSLISDEFYREIYPDFNRDVEARVEVQFIIHDWNGKLAAGLERVLSPDSHDDVLEGLESIGVDTGAQERFDWVKAMLTRLMEVSSETERYDILSGCAHVFPQSQIDKLAQAFSSARGKTDDPLVAVDAVIEFMEQDPGWIAGGRREGYTIYAVKPPSDKKAYDAAETDLERRQAYCFCPVIKSRIDQGMPVDYCYCGSGWFRQQWEGAVGKPVKIEIVRSVLRGEDACEFAIKLPEDI